MKGFISENSLDTPVFRLIRFRQKVLTESKPPLELFSLEEEATQLPGGLFVFAQSTQSTPVAVRRNCFVRRTYYAVTHFAFKSGSIQEDSCSATDVVQQCNPPRHSAVDAASRSSDRCR